MFLDFAFADKKNERWLEISDWEDLGDARHAAQGIQLWTRNSVYELGHDLRCNAVFDRNSGEQQADHPLVGQHLSGGFGRGEMILEDGLPQIGQAAVFSTLRARPATLRRTSRIERIRVRMRPATSERLSRPFGVEPVPQTA